jgi:NAD(P)-dependent dehydrogenase (short-subunit alcohol dehydrogenase family)
MKFDFQNKVALITGAGSGIGLATANAFAEAGASVTLSDVDEKAVQAAAKKLTATGYKVIAVKCNVAVEGEVAAMLEQTVKAFGRLDFAFNNAGIQVPVAETADLSCDDFNRAIAVNLTGVFTCMKYELQQLRKQEGSGAIVNCSSTGGIVGVAGMTAYNASKHGVLGLTKSAALEYAAKGIRINAICPGVTETPMVAKAVLEVPNHMAAIMNSIPAKRFASSEEIATIVLWLCSESAGFMIGQAVVPDGGYTVQ